MLTDKEYNLLFKIYHSASTLSSDQVRSNTGAYAKLACEGLITTHNSKEYANRWLITAQGIVALHQHVADMKQQEQGV